MNIAAKILTALLLPLSLPAAAEQTRVIGGVPASAAAYPYYVSLQQTSSAAEGSDGTINPIPADAAREHVCGGVLIAPDIVASAAHCPFGTTAVIAEIDGKLYRATEMRANTDYTGYDRADVAILKLHIPVPDVAPVAFAAPDPSLPAQVIGRGAINSLSAIIARLSYGTTTVTSPGANYSLVGLIDKLGLEAVLTTVIAAEAQPSNADSAVFAALVTLAQDANATIGMHSSLADIALALRKVSADVLTTAMSTALADNSFRSTNVGFATTAQCLSFVPSRNTEDYICVGRPTQTNQPGPCYGDSGGPLLQTRNGRTVVVGLTSSNTTRMCGEGLSVFTRGDAADKWIAKSLGASWFAPRLFDYVAAHYGHAKQGAYLPSFAYKERDYAVQCYAGLGCLGLDLYASAEFGKVGLQDPPLRADEILLVAPDGAEQAIAKSLYNAYGEMVGAGY